MQSWCRKTSTACGITYTAAILSPQVFPDNTPLKSGALKTSTGRFVDGDFSLLISLTEGDPIFLNKVDRQHVKS